MTDERTNGGTDEGVWWIVGLCLVGAATVLLLAGLVESFLYEGAGSRTRMEEILRFGTSIDTAALLLGAVITLGIVADRARHALTFVEVFAFVVVAGVIYSVIDIVTIHVPSFNSSDTLSFSLAPGSGGWKWRLAAILPRVAAGLVALAVIVISRRRRSSQPVAPVGAPDRA